MVIMSVSYGSLQELFAGAMTELEATLVTQGAPVGMAEGLTPLMPFMPGIVAASWLLMIVVNGALGQWLASRQSQAIRPSPSMRQLELPDWVMPGFAVSALLAVLLEGDWLFYPATISVILSVPLIFLGLAVVHSLAARLTAPRVALTAFYIALLLFAWPLIFVVLVLGAVENWANIRQRVAS